VPVNSAQTRRRRYLPHRARRRASKSGIRRRTHASRSRLRGHVRWSHRRAISPRWAQGLQVRQGRWSSAKVRILLADLSDKPGRVPRSWPRRRAGWPPSELLRCIRSRDVRFALHGQFCIGSVAERSQDEKNTLRLIQNYFLIKVTRGISTGQRPSEPIMMGLLNKPH
jgi:hypothetical protein